MRNLASKISEPDWPEFRAHAKACYEGPSQEVVRILRDELVQRYEKTLPTAVALTVRAPRPTPLEI